VPSVIFRPGGGGETYAGRALKKGEGFTAIVEVDRTARTSAPKKKKKEPTSGAGEGKGKGRSHGHAGEL